MPHSPRLGQQREIALGNDAPGRPTHRCSEVQRVGISAQGQVPAKHAAPGNAGI